MEPRSILAGLTESEATPSQEALRLIVEVFRDGCDAAANLRHTAYEMTPSQLEVQLEAIERKMLTQISRICDTYQLQQPGVHRH